MKKEDLLKGYTDENGDYHEAEFEFLLQKENNFSIKNILRRQGADLSDWRSLMKNESITPE